MAVNNSSKIRGHDPGSRNPGEKTGVKKIKWQRKAKGRKGKGVELTVSFTHAPPPCYVVVSVQ